MNERKKKSFSKQSQVSSDLMEERKERKRELMKDSSNDGLAVQVFREGSREPWKCGDKSVEQNK